MILDAKTHAPCTVWDANGVEVTYAVWCDTETGEAVHLIRGDDGFVLTINEEGEQVVKTEWRQHPAPLTYRKH